MKLIEENKKVFPWIIGIALAHFSIVQTVKVLYIDDPWNFDAQEVIFELSILFIPLLVVNIIFLFRHLFARINFARSLFWIPRILGLTVGVTIGTLFFEYIYEAFGIVDDDYYVFGEYQLSLTVSELIDNHLLAIIIGIPVFLKQRLGEKTSIAIKRKEEELEKAYQLKIHSELEALQSKVNPHFLYNSLNSIACLIHEDAAKAEKMILLLSDLFRYTLNYNEGSFSTIEEELKMVQAYLDIEMIRFEDSLKCEIKVDKEIQLTLIPRFLLQPLIENAIKHGTSKIQNGHIKLKILAEGRDILISVADNGPDFPKELSSGYGLKGTLNKLDLLYKDQYTFSLNNHPVKEIQIKLKNILRNE